MFAKTFRNTLVASSLLIGASLLAGPAAQAQVSDGGDVTGNVLGISAVDYTAPSAVTLNLAGNDNMLFGSVAVQDNTDAGWLLEVASTNGSKLIDPDSLDEIAYTSLLFTSVGMGNTTAIDVSTALDNVEVYNFTTLTCAAAPACTASITADIASNAINGKAAGAYSDTLTFTLTSN